ncbi:JAB domain-containing protein [Candidatus Thiosymbion oneisti]|uniref:JAB domain-containing protein n=1 Tax=Candidatus Thiosymbion oneisti TaxID=589554 RepID=UPI00105DE037|nr:JAB domain-containing protein [Candidatus Thiosymbion oneisti]
MEVKLSKQQKVTVKGSEDIYLIMRQILRRENKIGQGQEHFWMVGLNQANKILYIELVALGSSNMVGINPREAFRMAIYKLAVQVIMVHNHPGGNVTPSIEDEDLTDHFIQAGKFLKVEVIDHLIISDETYHSFVESGIFKKLQASERWVLPYKVKKRIRNEGKEEGLKEGKEEGLQLGEKIGKEEGLKEGEKKGKIEVAKALKQKEISITIIAETSGLSIEEIKKL